jgi:hypothetical protein
LQGPLLPAVRGCNCGVPAEHKLDVSFRGPLFCDAGGTVHHAQMGAAGRLMGIFKVRFRHNCWTESAPASRTPLYWGGRFLQGSCITLKRACSEMQLSVQGDLIVTRKQRTARTLGVEVRSHQTRCGPMQALKIMYTSSNSSIPALPPFYYSTPTLCMHLIRSVPADSAVCRNVCESV